MKHYVTLKGGIAAAFLISHFFCLTILADSGDVAVINGLSFVCGRCEVRQGPPCRVTFYDSSRISSCEEALAQLLEQAAIGKFNPEHPSPSELRTFLINTPQQGASAQFAMSLLLRTEAGRRAVIQDGYMFASKYSAELARSVTDDPAQQEVWSALWKLPSQEGISLGSELRAEILAHSPSLTANDLFADLSTLRTTEDVRDLETYENRLQKLRPELAGEIKKAREHLQNCGNPNLTPGEGNCDAGELTVAAGRFVNRVKLQWLIHAAESNKLEMPDFIDRLSKMSFEKARTPALHEALIKALDVIAKQPETTQKVCTPQYFPMFRVFAANDRFLGIRWAGLLTKQADAFFRAGKYDESVSLLEESFKAVPDPVEARIAFLNSIVYSDTWRDRADIQKRFKEAVRRGVPARPWYELSQERLVGVFAILSGLTFLWMIYFYIHRQRRAAEERAALEAEMTLLGEREELRELREFFAIGGTDGDAELMKSYRRKAKETHPDLYGGETEKFQEVQDKYQRAKELLGRRQPS